MGMVATTRAVGHVDDAHDPRLRIRRRLLVGNGHEEAPCAGVFVRHQPLDRMGCWRAHRHGAEDRIVCQVENADRAIAVADEGATGLRVEGESDGVATNDDRVR
jgi:hypothetical protein